MPLYMRSCSSEFNLWMPFSVEILVFYESSDQNLQEHMFSIRYRYPPWFYAAYIMQRFIVLSHGSVFFEPPSAPVQYVGSVFDDSYLRGGWREDVTLGKMAGLSAMTQSLPEKSRTRTQVRVQVQCSFNPDRKNFTIYSGHSFLNTARCLLSGFIAIASISLCLKSWLAI